MIEFLKRLFFAELMLLTPEGISFDDTYHLTPDTPIVALSQSAYVLINVEDMMADYKDKDVIAKLDALRERFPDGSIKVTLISATGEKAHLSDLSYTSSLEVIIVVRDDAIIGQSYEKLIIHTETPLMNVNISWANTM